MAHYVAELIQDVENTDTNERPAKMRVCSDAILSLWKHRHELPSNNRPFRELEPILKALESLDPDGDMPRYFRLARVAADGVDDKDETKSWLKLIDGLDYSARVLIRYFLTQAAQTAHDKSAKWVALAEAAGVDDRPEASIVRMIVDEKRTVKASDLDENARKHLEDRIERLKEFVNMATALVSDLRRQLTIAKGATRVKRSRKTRRSS